LPRIGTGPMAKVIQSSKSPEENLGLSLERVGTNSQDMITAAPAVEGAVTTTKQPTNSFDPFSCAVVEGSTRKDVVFLASLCAKKHVVQIGFDKWSLYLAQIAAEVVILTTDQDSIDKYRPVLEGTSNHCSPELSLLRTLPFPEEVPSSDVLLISGTHDQALIAFGAYQNRAETVVLLDHLAIDHALATVGFIVTGFSNNIAISNFVQINPDGANLIVVSSSANSQPEGA